MAINESVASICHSGGTRLLWVSTLNVFEGLLSILTERSPETPYAQSKHAGDLYFQDEPDQFPALFIVRPPNLFGKSQLSHFKKYGESHVIPDLIHKIKSEEKLVVWGDGTQERNFLHVKDFVDFLQTFLFSEEKYDERNIRSKNTVTIAKLVQEIFCFLGTDREVEFDPSYMNYERMKIGDIEDQLEEVGEIDSISRGLKE